jgi:hypothetical protein
MGIYSGTRPHPPLLNPNLITMLRQPSNTPAGSLGMAGKPIVLLILLKANINEQQTNWALKYTTHHCQLIGVTNDLHEIVDAHWQID